MDENLIVLAALGALAYWYITNKARVPPAIDGAGTAANPTNVPILSGDMSKPRGIRNNNPGNIKYSPANPWTGQIGKDSGGFVVFETPVQGLRAMAKLLKNYYTKYNLHTVRAITGKWSPDVNGKTGIYAANVATYSGIDPNIDLVLTPELLGKLMRGMIAVENGAAYVNFYSAADLAAGIAAS